MNYINNLPQYWCIKNDYQEVRDYLADKYDEKIRTRWEKYSYIGVDGADNYGGCHSCSLYNMRKGTVLITIEDFRNLIKREEYEIY